MDFEKLYLNLINKEFTDINLILEDNYNCLNTKYHKIILGSSCDYFYNLFTLFKEKNESSIKIKVNDVNVANDIILTFYGKNINLAEKDYNYILNYIECKMFFCLNTLNDVRLLYNIKVPEESFDWLLRVIHYFNFVEDGLLIKSVRDNIPKNYDWNNFDEMLINILQKKKTLAAAGIGRIIKIWDIENGELIRTLKKQKQCFCF
jgi:hypothetical protein